jgi:hypothetical protein
MALLDLNPAPPQQPDAPRLVDAPESPPHGRAGCTMHELGRHIGDIARRLLGPPNKDQSNGTTLRFGNGGSVAVEIAGDKAGSYFNFEHSRGGGAGHLIEFEGGIPRDGVAAWLAREMGIDVPKPAARRGKFNIVATYDYRDERGELLFQVCRLEPKDFRQRRPNGSGGWEWKVKGTPRCSIA